MKVIKHNWTSTEVEKPFDIEHLKDLFEILTEDGKVDFTDEDVLDEIENNDYIFSDDEMKQLPQLYNQWYMNNVYFQCRDEVSKTLDALCRKYSNADVESCINDYFN